MAEGQRNDEHNKKTWDMADFISCLLFIIGILSIFSSFMYAFSQDMSDKWFERQILGFLCLGFAGVIFKLRK